MSTVSGDVDTFVKSAWSALAADSSNVESCGSKMVDKATRQSSVDMVREASLRVVREEEFSLRKLIVCPNMNGWNRQSQRCRETSVSPTRSDARVS
jgi:hypothetical protein